MYNSCSPAQTNSNQTFFFDFFSNRGSSTKASSIQFRTFFFQSLQALITCTLISGGEKLAVAGSLRACLRACLKAASFHLRGAPPNTPLAPPDKILLLLPECPHSLSGLFLGMWDTCVYVVVRTLRTWLCQGAQKNSINRNRCDRVWLAIYGDTSLTECKYCV